MIEITLPDGNIKKFSKGISVYDIAKEISEGLARNVLSAKFNDQIIETSTIINKNGNLILYTWNDEIGKKAFWHSSAHILAQSIIKLYPSAKLTIGPAIENGFYYDVDFGGKSINENDLKLLERQFIIFAREKSIFKMRSSSKKDALNYYKLINNQYKIELIESLNDGEITFCDHSDFTDLCRGGHIPNTSFIKAVKLLNIAGAYWRGDQNKKQLTRIYGISFPKQKELTNYLELLNKAKERDHRKLGKELELFTFSEKVGQGLPLWLPKGAELRERLENFLKKAQKKAGYKQVITPHIGNKDLYITSGHYQKYGADSFKPIETPSDGETFLLKPMNCPHHCEIFNFFQWSYKDLPVRYAEFGTVYRYEKSGELLGLTRVRGFTQDDAHIFCLPSQLNDEFKKVEILINNWEFREQGQQWFPAIVPGSVHLDLYSNNLIDDPFYRANENKLQWIEDKQWEYKAEFNLDQDFIENKDWIFGLSGNSNDQLFQQRIEHLFQLAHHHNRIHHNSLHFIPNREAEMVKMFKINKNI